MVIKVIGSITMERDRAAFSKTDLTSKVSIPPMELAIACPGCSL